MEYELRVPVGEGVGVVGVVLEDEAGRVVVDEEQGREARIAVNDEAVEDHEIGIVGARHEPLLAVEQVVTGRRVPDGDGPQRASIRPRAVLGDGIAPRALAAKARFEVATALVGVGVEQDVVGARHVRPQAAGRLPELLVDEDLFDGRPTLAAGLDGERSAVEARVDRGAPDRVAPIARDAAVGAFELDLARLEDVPHERPGARLELELGGAEGEVHRGQGCPTRPRARAVRRGPQDGRRGCRAATYDGWARTMIRISVMSSIA